MGLLTAETSGLLSSEKKFSHEGDNRIDSKVKATWREKKGILLVHFGTSKEEARRALESINEHVEKEFDDYEIREAYTSRMVIKKIYNESGKRYLTPKEALEGMKSDGFTHMVVQASHVINGVEADHLKDEIREYHGSFKELRVGTSLLSTTDDYTRVANIFYERYKDKNIVLVGHGTEHHAGSAYGMLQYISERRGYNNIFVGTVEGYPGIDEVAKDLTIKNIDKVTLVPLMMVAGVHAQDDIAEDWKDDLEDIGIQVEVSMEGMGEIVEMQHLVIDHINDAISHIEENMTVKKNNILREIS